MLLEKYVIVADMATTTSMAATLQGVRLARAHHMVPSQEHAAVTLNTGTVTAKTTSLVESAINAEMVTMHWNHIIYWVAKVSLEFSRTNYHGLGPQKESKIAPKSCENKLVGEDAALHENREVSLTKLQFMGSCI